MGGVLPALLAPLAHFDLSLHFLLIFAREIIGYLASLATELY